MKVVYFDAFAGVSGDMTVGALLALGFSLDELRRQLSQLPMSGYGITARQVHVNGIAATKFDVEVADHGHHHHRPFRHIREMIDGSGLAPAVKHQALAIFTKLAEAEGKVHGVAQDDVEFHEVGAVDSIVDVVATAAGVAALGVERFHVSTLPLGSGIVHSQHGPLPVPGPATAELLRGFATRVDGEGELVTPTGAAIVAALASPAPMPEFRIEAIGYGAGQKSLKDRPNLLRLVLGEVITPVGRDEMVVIESNIDDYNPELYQYVMDRLFEAGARDVCLAPVHMKKNRPGIVLSLLCPAAERDRLAAIVLAETSAIGVRYHPVSRLVLAREMREVNTVHGPVRIKVALAPDGHENLAPEYDDCQRIAREKKVPIKTVYQAALAAAVRSSKRSK